jgi:biopolymer transport protein ExbD
VTPGGVRLNGVATEDADLVAAVLLLVETSNDLVILRARDGADVQRLVDVMGLLRETGLSRLTLVE